MVGSQKTIGRNDPPIAVFNILQIRTRASVTIEHAAMYEICPAKGKRYPDLISHAMPRALKSVLAPYGVMN